MGLRFGAIYFKKSYSGGTGALLQALDLALYPTGARLTLSQAASADFRHTAIGFFQERTLLHNNFLPYDCAFVPGEFYELDERLQKLSTQADVICFYANSGASSYGWSLFVDGRRARSRSVSGNDLLLDEGRPLPAEPAGPDADEEQRLFAVLSAFLGHSYPKLLHDSTPRLEVYQRREPFHRIT